MTRVLPVLLLLGLTIFTIVAILQADSREVRHLPRWLWLVIVILVPLIGLIAWWIFGRPVAGDEPGDQPRPARPVAPDDDPDFLRGL